MLWFEVAHGLDMHHMHTAVLHFYCSCKSMSYPAVRSLASGHCALINANGNNFSVALVIKMNVIVLYVKIPY